MPRERRLNLSASKDLFCKSFTSATSSKLGCSWLAAIPLLCRAFNNRARAVVRTSGATGGAPTMILLGACDTTATFLESLCFLAAGSANMMRTVALCMLYDRPRKGHLLPRCRHWAESAINWWRTPLLAFCDISLLWIYLASDLLAISERQFWEGLQVLQLHSVIVLRVKMDSVQNFY